MPLLIWICTWGIGIGQHSKLIIVINHSKGLKDKNHMIISVDAGNLLTKFNMPSLLKSWGD